ncbi:MAG: tRNA (adenosine(37)-N6)-dimethylallyltransferase MiaA [Eubacterium sp.]|nr:tRNA (adenosine(37)-N6)-dimethylallyltransferase MiaA [Eubacterium sp.]
MNRKEEKRKPLVILTGPTSVGKTGLSIGLAHKIGGEIISADSMQVYRGMDIGTAKITREEMDGIPHYLIDILEPDQAFNVVEFQKRVREAMEQIDSHGKIPILVGGTGFYIQALLYDIDFPEHSDTEDYRRQLADLAREKGEEYLHAMLQEVDPEYAASVHYHNLKRVIRALEYHRETGRKLSDHNRDQQARTSPYNFAYLVLNQNRDLLYERINRRVDMMMEQGLLREVRGLYDKGYRQDLVSMQGLGYKEFFDYFKGEIPLDQVVDRIKLETRRFAKRQLTWFRREKDVIWINKEDYSGEEEILRVIFRYLKEKGIWGGTP